MVFSGSDHRTSDFLELLQRERPELLSRFGTGAFGTTPLPDSPAASWKGQRVPTPSLVDLYDSLLEGTTILAAVYNEGGYHRRRPSGDGGIPSGGTTYPESL